MSASNETTLERAPLSIKLYYGVGAAAEGIKNTAFNVFLLFYYNQVLGLSGTMSGAAIFAALCIDALTDPLRGSISDNFHSRWGRRHPFMYLSALPMAVCFFLLFNPPAGLTQWGLFLWLSGFAIGVRVAMTLYFIPSASMTPEMTSHYDERTSLVSYRLRLSAVDARLRVEKGGAAKQKVFVHDSELTDCSALCPRPENRIIQSILWLGRRWICYDDARATHEGRIGMKLYRSILFVPGNRPEWIDKAPKYGPDALILDLEDAVPIPEKAEARKIVRAGIERSHQRGVPIVVRVNGLNTGLTGEDVEAVVTAGTVAIAIPKLERVEEVLKVDAWIELFEQKAGLPLNTVEIVALPETARGIMDIYKLATACPRVGNIVGGAGARSGDVTKAVGYKWTRAGFETLYIASHMLLAARAAGIEYPLTGGSLEVNDTELVRAQLQRAREIGFRGSLLIHPSAVPIANEVFAPSKEEIEWNKGVLQAMYDAEQAGRAAVTYDGMMIDYAHVRNALDLLHQAEAFGLEVGTYAPVKAL